MKEKINIIYNAKKLGSFGVTGLNIIDNRPQIFKLEDIVYLPNWKHKVDDKLKDVFLAREYFN